MLLLQIAIIGLLLYIIWLLGHIHGHMQYIEALMEDTNENMWEKDGDSTSTKGE